MTFTVPSPMIKPFCNSGDETPPPVTDVDPDIPNQEKGFTVAQSTPLPAGDPVTRPQMNGVLKYYTEQLFAVVNGIKYTFDADVAAETGGYPIGAILWCPVNNSFQRSLVSNNTANFMVNHVYIDDNVHWTSYQHFSFVDTDQITAGKVDTDQITAGKVDTPIILNGTDTSVGILVKNPIGTDSGKDMSSGGNFIASSFVRGSDLRSDTQVIIGSPAPTLDNHAVPYGYAKTKLFPSLCVFADNDTSYVDGDLLVLNTIRINDYITSVWIDNNHFVAPYTGNYTVNVSLTVSYDYRIIADNTGYNSVYANLGISFDGGTTISDYITSYQDGISNSSINYKKILNFCGSFPISLTAGSSMCFVIKIGEIFLVPGVISYGSLYVLGNSSASKLSSITITYKPS